MTLAMICAVGFLVLSGTVFALLLSTDKAYLAAATRTTDAEVAGETNLFTHLAVSQDASGDAAIALAVRQAREKLASGELSPEQARAYERLIKRHEGKGMADILRQNQGAMLMFEARSINRPDLAREIETKMAACKSTTCISMIGAEYAAKIRNARGG